MTTSARLRLAQIDQDVGEPLHIAAAETRGGLIQQQHLGAGAVGQRDRQEPLHAIGNVAGQLVVVLRGDADEFQKLRRDQFGLTPRCNLTPGKQQRCRQACGILPHDRGDRILQYRQFAEKRVLLERPAQAAAGEVKRFRQRNVGIVQKGLA